MTKFCPDCKIDKDTSTFNKANRRDGLRSYCRDCESNQRKGKLLDLKNQVYDKLGHVCCRCGFSDKRALQIDHVNGGGNRELKEVRNNATYLQKVIKDTEGTYQILCANCNWIKRFERNEEAEGNNLSEEGRKKICEARSNWSPTDEQRQRMVESHLGQEISLEHRSKLAITTAESWKIPEVREARIAGITGTKWTEEQRANQSEIAKTRETNMSPEKKSARAKKANETRVANGTVAKKRAPWSEERKKQHSEMLKESYANGTRKPRVWTEEQLTKVKGKKRTPEQIENLRIGAFKREAAKRELVAA